MTISPPLSSQALPRPNHFVLLDWMRFLSALLVVCCHIRPEHWKAWDKLSEDSHTWAAKLFFFSIRFGPEAVVVFFVLSGYLVGGKVVTRCLDQTFSPHDYFLDRFSRIFTPLLPAVALTAGCVWFLGRSFPLDYGWQVAGNLVQMQGILCERLEGNPSLWSLSYEVWFYVLAGSLAVLLIRRSGRMPAKVFITATGLVLFSSWCLAMLNTVYLICWIMGAIAHCFTPADYRRKNLAAGVAMALIGAALCQSTGTYERALLFNSEMLHTAGVLILGASVAFLLPSLVAAGTRMRNPAILKAGSGLAAFSYTLYLTHYPLLLVMRTWHAPYSSISASSLLLYLAKVAICIVVAFAFFLMFERNTSLVRRLLAKTWPPRSSA